MKKLTELGDKIKALKDAKEILKEEYSETEFHKEKEKHPHSVMPSSPKDEEVYKLLTAIQQLDKYLKEYQDEQFELLKKQDKE